ncbi:MAG TPA: hypothetical protein VKH42_16065 [Vicinamibacterales bacterium]|nr:hypothetical protein [Vicinamibacterales bacterium]
MAGKAIIVCALAAASAYAQKPTGDPASLLGTWRGTSTCTDRRAAPACADEVVVYEFKPGSEAGAVRWLADKIVDGKRESMGEVELRWDGAESVWKAEFSSPRVKSVWKLSVDGPHLTGRAQLLPGNETIRRIDVKKE